MEIWFLIAMFFTLGWGVTYWFYREIWHAKLKWWAIPFSHGAVFWGKRLPESWEKPE